MVGGDNSGSVSPVSAEVEAYEPLIRQYANQYGIGEYVKLIKAVMMQESGGRGLDLMQSSEGGFNTRYPRKPNGITDPEYSIQCGVQEVKSCLVNAGVENPNGNRQRSDCGGGAYAGGKLRGYLLELVRVCRQGGMVCLLCIVVCRSVQ